jgi:hypothetical protein
VSQSRCERSRALGAHPRMDARRCPCLVGAPPPLSRFRTAGAAVEQRTVAMSGQLSQLAHPYGGLSVPKEHAGKAIRATPIEQH